MKQSSLDDPGLGMEYEGGEPPNNTTANEGDGELIVFLGPGGPGGWNQSYYEDQNNQSQLRPGTPQLIKGKGNVSFSFSFFVLLIYSSTNIFNISFIRFTMDAQSEAKRCGHLPGSCQNEICRLQIARR